MSLGHYRIQGLPIYKERVYRDAKSGNYVNVMKSFYKGTKKDLIDPQIKSGFQINGKCL